MTEKSMLFQKVDLLNGLFPELGTEAKKDVCNAILADVLAMYREPDLYNVKEGSALVESADAEQGIGHETAQRQ
ncbi:hypothetical protein GCM10007978_05320 [Shewanella hanedai]|jgi:hypothetical protein|nr:hypothetical protein GCM10007978_05320 [Shewanella hanedai]